MTRKPGGQDDAEDWDEDDEPPIDERRRRLPIFGWLAVASAGAVLAGSFGPWMHVRALFVTVDIGGVSQARGMWTAGLAVAALVLLATSLTYRGGAVEVVVTVAATLCLAAAAWMGLDTWLTLEHKVRDATEGYGASIEVGWGLALVTVGGVAGTICTLLHGMLTGH